MPRHKNRVNFDPDTKNKTFSTATKKPSHFRFLYWNQVNFDHPHTQINFIRALNSSQVSSPHWNQVNLDHPHNNHVNFDAYTKTKWFRARVQKPSEFRPPTLKPSQSLPTLKQVIFGPHSQPKSIWPPGKKQGSISIPTLKSSQFRSLHWNKSISTTHTTKSISSAHWNQVKFHPHAEMKSISTITKSISMLTLNPSDIRPAYKNQFNSIPTLKPSQCRFPTQKPS